jgi:hypothetical protein
MNPQTEITVCQIEQQKLDEFYRLFDQGRFSGQRLGQAFYNHFELNKMTQNRPQLDRLYQLDGQVAKNHITMLFEPH